MLRLFWLLLLTFSLINETTGLSAPKLQQRSLDEAVAATLKQLSNLAIPAQDDSAFDSDTINHIQNTLEYLVIPPKLEPILAPVNSASQALATSSHWQARVSQRDAKLKRQTTCGDNSQCGNGNNSNGSGNGVNNTANGGGGSNTTSRNIQLGVGIGVGLGVGLPGAIVATVKIVQYLRRRRTGKSLSDVESPQQNGVAQSQVRRPYGVPEYGNQRRQQERGQVTVELDTLRVNSNRPTNI